MLSHWPRENAGSRSPRPPLGGGRLGQRCSRDTFFTADLPKPKTRDGEGTRPKGAKNVALIGLIAFQAHMSTVARREQGEKKSQAI